MTTHYYPIDEENYPQLRIDSGISIADMRGVVYTGENKVKQSIELNDGTVRELNAVLIVQANSETAKRVIRLLNEIGVDDFRMATRIDEEYMFVLARRIGNLTQRILADQTELTFPIQIILPISLTDDDETAVENIADEQTTYLNYLAGFTDE